MPDFLSSQIGLGGKSSIMEEITVLDVIWELTILLVGMVAYWLWDYNREDKETNDTLIQTVMGIIILILLLAFFVK